MTIDPGVVDALVSLASGVTPRPGFTMLDAFILVPIASLETADSKVLHRVELDGLPVKEWTTAEYATAVCGAQVKLLRSRWKDIRTRGTEYSRCAGCRTWKPVKS